MKKFLNRSVLPFFLVFLIVFSSVNVLTVSAFAVDVITALELITVAAGAIKTLFDAGASGIDFVATIKAFFASDNGEDSCQFVANNYMFNASMNRIETSKSTLDLLAQDWNNTYSASTKALWSGSLLPAVVVPVLLLRAQSSKMFQMLCLL